MEYLFAIIGIIVSTVVNIIVIYLIKSEYKGYWKLLNFVDLNNFHLTSIKLIIKHIK